jgi:hypothetical protein
MTERFKASNNLKERKHAKAGANFEAVLYQ